MQKYSILVAESVSDYLSKIDSGESEKIIKRISMLELNPKSVGEPRGKFWILKVGSSGYRLAFRILEETKEIRVTAIEKRSSKDYQDFYD